VLPKSDRMTLETAKKIEALHKSGAKIFLQTQITGTPGLEGYPEADNEVSKLAKNWPVIPDHGWESILVKDRLMPDFKGDDLYWIHRRLGSDDIYFLANSKAEPIERNCTFRINGKTPELWDPETGEIYSLSDYSEISGSTRVPLQFEAFQSWFVVFRDNPSSTISANDPFPAWEEIQQLNSKWTLDFDPEWGSGDTFTIDSLFSWPEHPDSLVKYYSGTASYRTEFDFSGAVKNQKGTIYLDLGDVGVAARVKLNGKDCGITWKPPYMVDITKALQKGQNELIIEVANTWANRLIGDEQLPLDSDWENWETLTSWPDWFTEGKNRPTDRFTFTSVRHYKKDSPLQPSGLLGPVRIMVRK